MEKSFNTEFHIVTVIDNYYPYRFINTKYPNIR